VLFIFTRSARELSGINSSNSTKTRGVKKKTCSPPFPSAPPSRQRVRYRRAHLAVGACAAPKNLRVRWSSCSRRSLRGCQVMSLDIHLRHWSSLEHYQMDCFEGGGAAEAGVARARSERSGAEKEHCQTRPNTNSAARPSRGLVGAHILT